MEESRCVTHSSGIWEGEDLGDACYIRTASPNRNHRCSGIALGCVFHFVEEKSLAVNQAAGLTASSPIV